MAQVLRNPQFLRLWIAQMVSIFGDFVALFAVQIAITFRMHGTAKDVTGVMVAFILPMAIVGPVAGVFVDRWNPRVTMIVSDLIRGGLIALLPFTTNLWQIYALFFALSTVSSFFLPAQSVTVPLLVKMEGLMAATGLMQQTMQFVRIFSPSAAAALVTGFGEAACYYLDSLTFVFSALMLTTLSYHRAVQPAARGFRAVLTDMGQGMKFILTHRKFSFVIVSMTAGTFAIASFGVLISVYVRDVLKGSAYFFGAVGSTMAVGTILGAAAVLKLSRGKAPADLVNLGMFLVGCFIAVMVLFHNQPMTIACAFLIGVSIAFIMVAATTLLQGESPPEMRGRISSSSMAMICAGQGIAMLFAGDWATRFGIDRLFLGSAGMLFLVAISGVWWLRRTV
ncbi:MAG TPA: MFS transporter [Bryobacteraceae bacterium]|nr:MFS transporter [Bryobacteraceae bacterium]